MLGELSRRQLLWLGMGTAGASGVSRLAAASVAKNSPTFTVATATQNEPDLQSLTAASFGARGDGNIDDTTALQAAVNAAAVSGRDLSLGRGIYFIRADVLSLKSGVRIKGEAGATLLVKEVEPSTTAILKGHKVENILIEGVTFAAPSDSIWALDFLSSRRIRILRNVAKNCALIRCSAGPERSYDSITEADCCGEVTVSDNILHGPPKRLANGGIHLRHTLRAAVLRNHVRRHGHGIWWWGGDAGKIADEGSPRSPCWVRDVLIADNDIAEISSHAPYSGGGIWGSKGQRVAVLRNKVADCSDLEIGFEGCLNYRAMENVIHSTTSNASLAYSSSAPEYD